MPASSGRIIGRRRTDCGRASGRRDAASLPWLLVDPGWAAWISSGPEAELIYSSMLAALEGAAAVGIQCDDDFTIKDEAVGRRLPSRGDVRLPSNWESRNFHLGINYRPFGKIGPANWEISELPPASLSQRCRLSHAVPT